WPVNGFVFLAADVKGVFHVTGVRTYALPVYARQERARSRPIRQTPISQRLGNLSSSSSTLPVRPQGRAGIFFDKIPAAFCTFVRSEERRVGKEGGGRWWAWTRGEEEVIGQAE